MDGCGRMGGEGHCKWDGEMKLQYYQGLQGQGIGDTQLLYIQADENK